MTAGESAAGAAAPGGDETVPSGAASSPYASGGGGVTLERRVVAQYFAMMLTGDTSAELGDDRAIVSVAFQQAPRVPVDDLVILAAREDEQIPSLELAVGVRRAPQFVPSDADTCKLIVECVRAMLQAPDDGMEHRLAIAVAGQQTHAAQVATLAGLAKAQPDAAGFHALVQAPRYRQDLVDRLDYLKKMVALALPALGITADEGLVSLRTWELLSRLTVLMPRVEDPDTTNWINTQNRLVPVAHGTNLAAAGRLVEHLESLAAEYIPKAAVLTLTDLRRASHSLLESAERRNRQGWAKLTHLHDQATAAVRHELGTGASGEVLHLDRTEEGAAIVAAATGAAGTIVHGESGTGKSALILDAVTAADGPDMDVLCLNLKHLPDLPLDLEATLGCTLRVLLSEMSAPARLLVIDGADAALETKREVLTYVVREARESGVRVAAIAAADGREIVCDLLKEHLGAEIGEHAVGLLGDSQVEQIVAKFPMLSRLADNARSRELLRRLVVVDLLVRSGESDDVPVADADAMQLIWAGLIRDREQHRRGLPDAREHVLVQLAARELAGTPAVELVGHLDAAAVAGLRHDGVLRSSVDNPWHLLPDFAHDELRRYALARVLLADANPAGAIQTAGAPRWAMPAARLACQVLLAQSDQPSNPERGRLHRVQAPFDAMHAAGHPARWGDVPGEALLTLADPGPLLANAWPSLQDADSAGLLRLLRLVNQRHRRDGIIDPVVAEPLVALVLEQPEPWLAGKKISALLLDWLLALIAGGHAPGHPLRRRLREHLVSYCDAGQRRFDEQREAAAAARAARTAEEIEEDRRLEERRRAINPIGFGRASKRRQRPGIPSELADDTVLELLALLGPDLGKRGEKLLRQVARDAPWDLAPTVEECLTSQALASYSPGLLADLTEAYYLDEDEDGTGLREDGVRGHHWRGPISPMAAWYRGPFLWLFRSDLRSGIAVVNRILNHAARARIRSLAGLSNPWNPIPDELVGRSGTELRITGEPRVYFGDPHVWCWYRGTTVGPYPCMSALQALERLCDQLVGAGIPLDRIVALLLEGCENLAMPGLAAGLMVRHLERAGTAIDPYLVDPLIWDLEIFRRTQEAGVHISAPDDVAQADRRAWTFQDVAVWLVIHANEDRDAQLKAIAAELTATAQEDDAATHDADAGVAEPETGRPHYAAIVRRWAGMLDRDLYQATPVENGIQVQYAPPEEVEAELRPGAEEIERGWEATRLVWRYVLEPHAKPAEAAPITREELTADLATARDLARAPSGRSPVGVWNAPAAVAAAALKAHICEGMDIPADLAQFAVSTVLTVADLVIPAAEGGYQEQYFEQGADRVAARALPLLLLPAAAALHDAPAEGAGANDPTRVSAAATRVAQASDIEVRLYLARGLDPIWETPCGHEPCHHQAAYDLVIETMRDCVLGPWDFTAQKRRILRVSDPVADSVAEVAGTEILIPRLDAAIRALGTAICHDTCVHQPARALLLRLLGAQRRGLLASEHNPDDRGTHALVTARAMLSLAATGDHATLREQIDAYADNGTQLGSLLRALSAAAEETPLAAQTARAIWPGIITQVTGFLTAGHQPFEHGYFGQLGLAALIPEPAYNWSYLYREVQSTPLAWTDALAWRPAIEMWLPFAVGQPPCVDSLVVLLRTLSVNEQVRTGLPWVAALVMPDPGAVAGRCRVLQAWLPEIRTAADGAGMLPRWQDIIDALVVAGDTVLAPYSD